MEVTRQVSQGWMQERFGEEFTDITATQTQTDTVKVIQLLSQERIHNEPLDVKRGQRATMYLLVAEKWTRQRFEHRTPEMRLRLPLGEVPTMIASEPTDTYMDHDAKYWLYVEWPEV